MNFQHDGNNLKDIRIPALCTKIKCPLKTHFDEILHLMKQFNILPIVYVKDNLSKIIIKNKDLIPLLSRPNCVHFGNTSGYYLLNYKKALRYRVNKHRHDVKNEVNEVIYLTTIKIGIL